MHADVRCQRNHNACSAYPVASVTTTPVYPVAKVTERMRVKLPHVHDIEPDDYFAKDLSGYCGEQGGGGCFFTRKGTVTSA